MKEKTSLMPNAHPQLPPIDTPLTPIGEKIKIRFEDFIHTQGPECFEFSHYLGLQAIFII